MAADASFPFQVSYSISRENDAPTQPFLENPSFLSVVILVNNNIYTSDSLLRRNFACGRMTGIH